MQFDNEHVSPHSLRYGKFENEDRNFSNLSNFELEKKRKRRFAKCPAKGENKVARLEKEENCRSWNKMSPLYSHSVSSSTVVNALPHRRGYSRCNIACSKYCPYCASPSCLERKNAWKLIRRSPAPFSSNRTITDTHRREQLGGMVARYERALLAI